MTKAKTKRAAKKRKLTPRMMTVGYIVGKDDIRTIAGLLEQNSRMVARINELRLGERVAQMETMAAQTGADIAQMAYAFIELNKWIKSNRLKLVQKPAKPRKKH